MWRRVFRVMSVTLSLVFCLLALCSCSGGGNNSSGNLLLFDSQPVPKAADQASTASGSKTSSGAAGPGEKSSSAISRSAAASSSRKSNSAGRSSSSATSGSSKSTSSCEGSFTGKVSPGSGTSHSSKSAGTSSGSSKSASSSQGSSTGGASSGSSSGHDSSSSTPVSQPATQPDNALLTINNAISSIQHAESLKMNFANSYDDNRQIERGYRTCEANKYYLEKNVLNTKYVFYYDGVSLHKWEYQRGVSFKDKDVDPTAGYPMLIMPLLEEGDKLTQIKVDGGQKYTADILPDHLKSYRDVFSVIFNDTPDNPANTIQSLEIDFTVSPQGMLTKLEQRFKLTYKGYSVSLTLTRQFEGINSTTVTKPD